MLFPLLMMICCQAIWAITSIVCKLAIADGMRLSVLIAYRFLFGASILLPITYFMERGKRPNITWRIGFYGFLIGLFGGSFGQNLYLQSLAMTSPTFVSAMGNLTPAMTFIVAIILRIERLNWNTASGKAKVFGTVMSIGGAMFLTFYKGKEFNIWNTHINLLQTTSHHRSHQNEHNLILGGLLAVCTCVSFALWYIVQAMIGELYPFPHSITGMMIGWGLIQSILFAVVTEDDWSNWHLGWDIRLLAVTVAGVLASGVLFLIVSWCVRMRGPLFVSIFNPLLLVMVAIAGSLILEEKIYLGMVIGSVMIIGGLYSVLWGKSHEPNRASQLIPPNDQANKESREETGVERTCLYFSCCISN